MTTPSLPLLPEFPMVPNPVNCLGCGCLCQSPDARFRESKEGGVTDSTGWLQDCPVGWDWVQRGRDWVAAAAAGQFPWACRGETVLEQLPALELASHWLRAAQTPLITGLRRCSLEAQRWAVALAEQSQGVLDGANRNEAVHVRTVQRWGEVTVSWGEITDRADCVVFWRTDPQRTHPRWVERILNKPGRFRPHGRSDRRILVVQDTDQPNATAQALTADQVLSLNPAFITETLRILLAWVQSREIHHAIVQSVLGPALEPWRQLADTLRATQSLYQVWVIGESGSAAELMSLHQIVRYLNRPHQRCVMTRLGGTAGDVGGSKTVSTWQTGYPHAIDFASSAPHYAPMWANAENMIRARMTDLVLVVGDPDDLDWAPETWSAVADRPQIWIGPNVTRHPYPSLSAPHVLRLATAPLGIAQGGTVIRPDGPWRYVTPFWPQSETVPTDVRLLQYLTQMGVRSDSPTLPIGL